MVWSWAWAITSAVRRSSVSAACRAWSWACSAEPTNSAVTGSRGSPSSRVSRGRRPAKKLRRGGGGAMPGGCGPAGGGSGGAGAGAVGRGGQPEIVQDAGAQVAGDTPDRRHGLVQEQAHVAGALVQLGRRECFQALVQPGDGHLQPSQGAAQLVVDLARDAGALFLAGGL